MDALMAALVAALLIRATDKSTDYVADAAERSGRTGAVLAAALLALLVTQTIAAIAGVMIGPHLNLHAQRLMFAFALLTAGGGAIWGGKPAKPDSGKRPFVEVTARLIATGLGDRTQFATFAVAAGGMAGLAGAGGLIGSFVVLAVATLAGAQIWRSVPHRMLGYVAGGVLVAAGAWLAVSALRLI
jgi:putative Ca2+/H+ antiporter (TMEM165/GDT1 family)